ncbi:MAG: CoA pyrophosphatase [Lachnospiraceae bacterium]|jgi:coenzyme A diphosphatase NUDT7|nr:CoA pyrophosphatase [Lachnospiraceae bacterium]MEE3461256.1 CoA pyrophosphatase [Lachnospiraceae bacterium]
MENIKTDDMEKIENLLKDHDFEPVSYKHRSAVLIPLIRDEGTLNVLFEVRSSRIVQGGDICLPGGHIESGESPEDACIRETKEELFVSKDNINIFAPLTILGGPRSGIVYSFAGELKNYRGTFSQDEIERIFTLPLDYFLNVKPIEYECPLESKLDENYPERLLNKYGALRFSNKKKKYFFYDTSEGLIWGLTAEVLYEFSNLLHRCGY